MRAGERSGIRRLDVPGENDERGPSVPAQDHAVQGYSVRRARTSDVPRIQALVEPLIQEGILLGKDRVVFYEAVQEFRVAEDAEGRLIGCGALHVMWEDLAEVRTLAVSADWLGHGVGHALLDRLEADARELGLSRLFCLTFEVPFFSRHGFVDMGSETVDPAVYAELVRSHDEGVAEFLDLARVKPNTLGNTRMVKRLA
ncbi:amino-acid N-acetyltransferase [Cryobacterium sp. Sr8]|nr:amino-acid N-acetyltransferase [Cryobacterium sp. Sr8]